MTGKWWRMESNNGKNSGPLTLLPVDRPTATECNADCSCKKKKISWPSNLPEPLNSKKKYSINRRHGTQHDWLKLTASMQKMVGEDSLNPNQH